MVARWLLLNREKWNQRLKAILSLDSHPGHIAAGFAAGVFISFTPFFGVHTPMAVAAAFIFRLNKVTCVTGAWVNTPVTVVPALLLSHKLGLLLLGRPPQTLHLQELTFAYALELLKSHGLPIMVGSSLIGFGAALLAYFLIYSLVVRSRQRDEALAEMTEEMEEVGEDLD